MVTRESKVEQSVYDYIVAELRTLDYGADIVQTREAFPTVDERASELKVTTVAIATIFDDGGTLIEIGSDLTERVYTVDCWVFGTDGTIGSNVANVIRTICESNYGLIPLKDIGAPGQPVIDQLIVDEAATHRQMHDDPDPWDRFVWSTTAKVLDTYYPSLQ